MAFTRWRGWRPALPLLLLGFLPGCWMSNDALIGADLASPVPFQGPYEPAKDKVVVTVTANDDGSYSLIDNNGKGFTSFFLKVKDDWYIVQHDFKEVAGEPETTDVEGGEVKVEAEKGEGPWLYNLMQLKGRDIWFYMPDCDDATQAVDGVKIEGEAPESMRTCTFETLAALQQSAPKYIERIEAGEIEEEPGVLRGIDAEAE